MDLYRQESLALFDGSYQGGYVVLVEPGDYYEHFSGIGDEDMLRKDIQSLTNLRRVIGDAWLVPVLPTDEEDEDFCPPDPGSLNVEEKDGGARSRHDNVPMRFLRNVLGEKLPLPLNRKLETELLDGPAKVGDDVWLMSFKRIDEDVFPTIKPISLQADLAREVPTIEDLRRAYPSGRYQILEIEETSKGDYCLIETSRGEQVRVFAKFLIPCNRPPRKRYGF